jgi:hypothetical protein
MVWLRGSSIIAKRDLNNNLLQQAQRYCASLSEKSLRLRYCLQLHTALLTVYTATLRNVTLIAPTFVARCRFANQSKQRRQRVGMGGLIGAQRRQVPCGHRQTLLAEPCLALRHLPCWQPQTLIYQGRAGRGYGMHWVFLSVMDGFPRDHSMVVRFNQ